jgi:hypothetical protein
MTAMTTRLLARMWRSLGAAPAVLLCVASFAYCQEPLPAPAGGTAVADEYRAKLAEWIPQLSAEPESSRYAPRMAVLAFSAAVSAPGAEDRRVLWEQELLAALQREDTPQPSRVWLVRPLAALWRRTVQRKLRLRCASCWLLRKRTTTGAATCKA